MNSQHIQLNVPLNFNQVIDIVKQLSPNEKKQLSKVLESEKHEDNSEINEYHKQIVAKRLQNLDENPQTGLSWKDIEDKIKL